MLEFNFLVVVCVSNDIAIRTHYFYCQIENVILPRPNIYMLNLFTKLIHMVTNNLANTLNSTSLKNKYEICEIW